MKHNEGRVNDSIAAQPTFGSGSPRWEPVARSTSGVT
jgi:hypothetical protein